MNRAVVLGGLVVLVACGNDENRPANMKPIFGEGGAQHHSAGASNRAGTQNKGGGATGGGGAMTGTGTGGSGDTTSAEGGMSSAGAAGVAGWASLNPMAPIVTITSPTSSTDPNDVTHVLTADLVDVTCKAEAANIPGATVNVGTTGVVMYARDSATPIDATLTTSTPTGVVARFNLSTVPTGQVTFLCVSHDNSSEAVTGTSEVVNALVDHGATIAFAEPTEGASWGIKTPLKVTLTVTPTPLSATDPLAATESVILKVDDRAVPVTEVTPGSGVYTSTVSLEDPTYFALSDLPSGATVIRVIVTNKRGAIADPSITINVDGTSPVVSAVSPADRTVIGGDITLTFTATDPKNSGTSDEGSGIDPAKTTVWVNSKPVVYDSKSPRWTYAPGTGVFTFNFPESELSTSVAQAVLNIDVGDLAGNSATSAQSLTLFIDNVPPLVSLDPPTLREIYLDGTTNRNSSAFDPLGEAVNDLSIVYGGGSFRALVWDLTNVPVAGATELWYAGTNPTTVRLWMQDDVDQPLLKDTNGDGICDAIDEGPATAPAKSLTLLPINPLGTSPRLSADGTAPVDDTRFWTAPLLGANSPTKNDLFSDWLCAGTSDMIRVTQHSMVTSTESVVYGHIPTASGLGCTGTYWEFSSSVDRAQKDGWVCFAAEATDRANNLGISPLLRVCYDYIDPKTGENALIPTCATNRLADPEASTYAPWVGSAPQRSAEAPTCKLNCTLPTIDPVRYVRLPR